MKLEEVLPAYREGKTIISHSDKLYQKERRNGKTCKLAYADEDEFMGEWEIEKEKVKKYPVLVKSSGYFYSMSRYKFTCLKTAQ